MEDDKIFLTKSGAPARLGILGGTFDPPHRGHLAAARAARDLLDLDLVLLVVAHDPWQKSPSREVSPAPIRLEMVRALIGDEEGIMASDREILRAGPSYSIETVEELRNQAVDANLPLPEIFLIIGADLATQLETWKRPKTLKELVTLAVVTRPGENGSVPPGWRYVAVGGVSVTVSSSQIRAGLASQSRAHADVEPAVMRVIERHHLYNRRG